MGNRADRLVVALCLSIVGAFAALGSIEPGKITYAVSPPTEQNRSYITISSVVTPTLEPRVYLPAVMRNFCTPMPIPADATLFGVVFFDYNGDGIQQPGEPGIVGANISVGSASTSSQCDGVYYFRNLPTGYYNLVTTADGYRYLSVSRSDFKTIGTPIQVAVGRSTRRDVGLMQGFLTLPFLPGTDFQIGRFYDWNPEPSNSLWWDGTEGSDPNNHIGIDYDMPVGTTIVASAPGTVAYYGEDSRGIFLVLEHPQHFYTDYGHISKALVGVGANVDRGQPIAISGATYNTYPHLHFHFAYLSAGPGNALLDPYHPIANGVAQGNWSFTEQGGWEWISPGYFALNALNWWTVDNSPRFP